MLTPDNIRRCLFAAALCLFIAPAMAVHAQRVSDERALPDAAVAVDAYLRVRGWVDRFDPPAMSAQDASISVGSATGACIILRRSGRVVGLASEAAGRSGSDLLIRRVAGRAMAEVLGDPAVAALPDDMRDQIGTGLTLELELAGSMQPLLGRSFDRIATQIDPGLDGVAMRRGDRWAMLYPAQLRASNSAGRIASRLPGLAAELGLPAADLATLVQQHNVTVYRFRTVHLAQERPGGLPFATVRGDQRVPDSAVTARSIAELADGLAQYLINSVITGERFEQQLDRPVGMDAAGLLGDYSAAADAYRPLLAPPLDQAIVSFALARYATTPGVDGETAQQARTAATALLLALAEQDIDPVTAAAVIYALSELPDSGAALERLFESAAASVRATIGDKARRDAFSRALLAGALARLLLSDEDQRVEPAQVQRAISEAWATTPEHQHVVLLPWIGWAEVDRAAATGQPIEHVDAMRDLRELLESARVSSDDGAAPDLDGGFALTRGGTNRPTAQSTRPAAFFATMLRIPELTFADEKAIALGRHLRTMRFLMQLRVRPELAWSYRNPQRAMGGLRAATWDSDQPVAAQAMGLLTAVETLHSLDEQ